MSKMLVDIDFSLRSHHVQFMDVEGRSLASFSVSNDQTGADTLIKKILETSEKTNSQHLQSEIGLNYCVKGSLVSS